MTDSGNWEDTVFFGAFLFIKKISIVGVPLVLGAILVFVRFLCG